MWKRYWRTPSGFSILKINTALYISFGLGFVKQTWSIYTVRLYPDKSRIKWVTLHQKTNESDGVLLVSAPTPLPTPQIPCRKYNEVQNYSFSIPPHPVLVLLVFFLVFGGIRVPSQSLFIERDDHLRTLHVGLLRRHQVGFIRVFPAQTTNTKATSTDFHSAHADKYLMTVIQSLMFQFKQLHTNHFMRNMSSPVESVAPIILSGSSPRAKPLSFSVWGSNNKIQLQSHTEH